MSALAVASHLNLDEGFCGRVMQATLCQIQLRGGGVHCWSTYLAWDSHHHPSCYLFIFELAGLCLNRVSHHCEKRALLARSATPLPRNNTHL
jgi:hypothetical protein